MSSRSLLIAVVLPWVAILLYQALNPVQKKENVQLQDFSVIAPTPAASSSVFQSQSSSMTTSESVRKPILELAPTQKMLRKEVMENVHQTPPSMLKFAATLAARLDEAEASEEAADRVFFELKDCVLNPAGAINTQALCLSNAKRLAGKKPRFQSHYEDTESRASDEVVRLSR